MAPLPPRRRPALLVAPTLASLLGGLVVGWMIAARALPAATITVDTTNDGIVLDGNCTLREAVEAANADMAVDACQAGSGADTIVVPAGVYVLTAGELGLNSDLTLEGAGAVLTLLDGAGLTAVLHVLGDVARIRGVNVRNGSSVAGGGIRTEAGTTLTLENAIVRNNFASCCGGGIANLGTLTLVASTVAGNTATDHAGGIDNTSGVLTLVNSNVIGNVAQIDRAGGILNFDGGTTTLVASTVGDNSAPNLGGGIDNRTGAELMIVASAITGNSAGNGAGVFVAEGLATLVASSVTGNVALFGGGGVLNEEGNVVLVGSTIAGNVPDDCVGCQEGGTGVARTRRRPQAGSSER